MKLAGLEAAAPRISPEDRSLPEDRVFASVSGQDEVDRAWRDEVDRRLFQVEAGDAELVPVEQAIQHARQAIS